jgi:hypothetical protein
VVAATICGFAVVVPTAVYNQPSARTLNRFPSSEPLPLTGIVAARAGLDVKAKICAVVTLALTGLVGAARRTAELLIVEFSLWEGRPKNQGVAI